MKQLIDITFDEFKDIANISTNYFINNPSTFDIVEVINIPNKRKLEYLIYGEKEWKYINKNVRLYMKYKDYVNLLSSQYGSDMLTYFNTILPITVDTEEGKYIYLSELYEQHKQVLELFNCNIEYFDNKFIIKRYFEIDIVNDKWNLYHGQYDENNNIMLFIIYNQQLVKDYCKTHDINCVL